MISGEKMLDWGMAETLAYATLLDDGKRIRISGQDSGRGTFFHRHAVLHNQNDASTYIPLSQIHAGQARLKSLTQYCQKRRYWHSNTAMRQRSLAV